MSKSSAKRFFVCQTCGASSLKWLGRCPACNEWDTLIEEVVAPVGSSPTPSGQTLAYADVDKLTFEQIETWNPEFDRVVMPAGNLPLPEPVKGIEIVSVSNVGEFLEAVGL